MIACVVWTSALPALAQEPQARAGQEAAEDTGANLRTLAEMARLIAGITLQGSQGAGHDALQEAVEKGTPLFVQWVQRFRDEAVADGVQPIPAAVRKQLKGFFPDALLARARYRVGWEKNRGTAQMLFDLAQVRAVALIDVIVFRTPELATDPVLWAHELAHLQQYEQWGTAGFGRRYILDHKAVETAAWDVSSRYKMWALEHGRLAGSPDVPAHR